ncbi:MAG: MBL fold metallo-hydrolase [Spirochaetota bacterium]|nr:MBL fold metallo-hydrolase [Spirochaetota bacterium]
MFFRQLFDIKGESSTYTYLLTDDKSKDGIIIDTVIENVDRDSGIIKELGINIKYIMDTHIHADHITGAGKLKQMFGCETVIGSGANVKSYDIGISDGESLSFGSHIVKAISTPGHTDSCTTFHIDNMIFTGDAVLYRGCGRTDFQQGDSRKLYHSVRDKLFVLDKDTLIYPAHDYNGRMVTTIGEEKAYNARLRDGISENEFVEIMKNLNLAKPKKIDIAVPANLKCGL